MFFLQCSTSRQFDRYFSYIIFDGFKLTQFKRVVSFFFYFLFYLLLKHFMRWKIFFILIVFSKKLFAQNQQNDFHFEHLNETNGLSNNHVQCIYKDSKGYLWFGTEDGLNRFDGNEFKVFKHQFFQNNSLTRCAFSNHLL